MSNTRKIKKAKKKLQSGPKVTPKECLMLRKLGMNFWVHVYLNGTEKAPSAW